MELHRHPITNQDVNPYPDLHCGTANEGTEYITFPYCGGRIAPQRYVWFGEDPIRSISLSVTPLG